MSLGRLSARLAQNPGQHRVGRQEIRQLAPSDEPVGEVGEPLRRGASGQKAAVAGPAELQHQGADGEADQSESEPLQELLGQLAGLAGRRQLTAGRDQQGLQTPGKRPLPVVGRGSGIRRGVLRRERRLPGRRTAFHVGRHTAFYVLCPGGHLPGGTALLVLFVRTHACGPPRLSLRVRGTPDSGGVQHPHRLPRRTGGAMGRTPPYSAAAPAGCCATERRLGVDRPATAATGRSALGGEPTGSGLGASNRPGPPVPAARGACSSTKTIPRPRRPDKRCGPPFSRRDSSRFRTCCRR
jgi:hypothetical protein